MRTIMQQYAKGSLLARGAKNVVGISLNMFISCHVITILITIGLVWVVGARGGDFVPLNYLILYVLCSDCFVSSYLLDSNVTISWLLKILHNNYIPYHFCLLIRLTTHAKIMATWIHTSSPITNIK